MEKELFSAKKYALICSPWVSPSFAKKIIQLVDKNVQVRLITSNQQQEGKFDTLEMLRDFTSPPKDFLGRSKKGWTPPPFDYKIIEDAFIHAKIYVIDGTYAVVGSANLTEYGLWKNVEHIVMTHTPEDVAHIESDYEHLWTFYEEHELVEERISIINNMWNKLRNIKDTTQKIVKKEQS
ncbi:MAG: phospholipase D family protein [Nitrosopumilaceae archaeon]